MKFCKCGHIKEGHLRPGHCLGCVTCSEFTLQKEINDAMEGLSRVDNPCIEEVLRQLAAANSKVERLTKALESISGCVDADYAVRRANEALAETGVAGY